jgi:HAD superfamily hydrolase (TIGR01458 family)
MAAADGRIAEWRVGIGSPYNAAMPEGAGRRIRGLLLDLDGTIYQAGSPIPGVGKTLAALREAGLSFRFVTNTTRKPRSAVLAALRQMGIEAKEGEVLTATVAAAAWLRRQGAERALLLLPEAAREDFPGLEPTAAEPEYVVVGDLGDAWSYQLLNRAFRALKAGASLVAIQRNRFWESDDGLALDAGAFVAALEYATDTEAELVGKPSPAFFAAAVADLGMARVAGGHGWRRPRGRCPGRARRRPHRRGGPHRQVPAGRRAAVARGRRRGPRFGRRPPGVAGAREEVISASRTSSALKRLGIACFAGYEELAVNPSGTALSDPPG